MKKLASIVLAIGMIVSTLITPVSAASSNQVNSFSRVESYTYSDVREYIQEAHSGVTLTISETPVHYYYGDGYTAYEKNGVLQIKVKHQNEKSPAKFARPKKGATNQTGEKVPHRPR